MTLLRLSCNCDSMTCTHEHSPQRVEGEAMPWTKEKNTQQLLFPLQTPRVRILGSPWGMQCLISYHLVVVMMPLHRRVCLLNPQQSNRYIVAPEVAPWTLPWTVMHHSSWCRVLVLMLCVSGSRTPDWDRLDLDKWRPAMRRSIFREYIALLTLTIMGLFGLHLEI